MSQELKGIRFLLAEPAHEPGLRELLRHTPMEGNVAIAFSREPSFEAAARAEGGEHHTIIAVDADERVVCCGNVAIRQRYLNGEPRRVGDLGQLRLSATHAGRVDIVRRGYAFFESLLDSLHLDFCFTAVVRDNARAKRLLERGLPGMPQYVLMGGIVTLLIRVKPPIIAPERADPASARMEFERNHPQLAPVWSDAELSRSALFTSQGAVSGIWDQRAFKQTRVVRYSRRMAIARPLYNCVARCTNWVPLPPAGDVLAHAFVSPLAAPGNDPEALANLVESLMQPARERGIVILTLGLDLRDPRLPDLVRRFRPRLYHSSIYSVVWSGRSWRVGDLDGRLLQPEVALL